MRASNADQPRGDEACGCASAGDSGCRCGLPESQADHDLRWAVLVAFRPNWVHASSAIRASRERPRRVVLS